MTSSTPESRPNLVKIGSLWIDGPLSWLEVASLESFVALGHDVALYTYGNIPNVPSGIDLRDAREVWDNDNIIIHKEAGSPAPHSDVFRIMMNAQTGRVWVDTDVIALRPFDRSIKWFIGHERTDKVELGNAVLGFPPDSKLLAGLYAFLTDPQPVPPWLPNGRRKQLAEIRRKHPDFGFADMAWGTSGPKALTHFAVETGEIEHARPQHAFFPVSFQDRKLLVHHRKADILDEHLARSESYSVHLYSRWLRKTIKRGESGLPPRDSWIGRWGAKHGFISYPQAHKDAVVAVPPVISEPVEKISKDDIKQNKAMNAAIEATVVEKTATAFASLPERKKLIPDGANVSRHGRVSIVTMAKDEGPYILEWVAHHHILGFTDILAFTNNCTDGTDEMFNALADIGLVTRLDNPEWREKPPQSRALHWAEISPYVRESDWLLVMDLDEFVCIKMGDRRLDDLIDDIVSRDATGMCLSWRFFGSSNIDHFEPKPVTERLVHAAPDNFTKGYGIKTLFKNDHNLTLAIHRPYLNIKFTRTDEGKNYPVNWLNGDGEMLDGTALKWRLNKNQVGYDLAQVNHYGVKTREEYLLRRLRGDVLDNNSKYNAEYFGVFDRDEIEDTSALDLVEERRAFMRKLMRVPAIKNAAELIENRRQARLEKLRSSAGYQETIESLVAYPIEVALKVKRH